MGGNERRRISRHRAAAAAGSLRQRRDRCGDDGGTEGLQQLPAGNLPAVEVVENPRE